MRATDDLGLTTSSTNQGRLTINANIAGDLPPNATITFAAPTDESLTVNLAGTATDDIGVERVRVSLQDRDTGRYLQANGTMAAALAYRDATLNPPNATSTAWSLPPITLPTGGNWRFTALANDRVQQDPSAATATYAVYPNDGPPSLSDTLGQPQNGASFTDGKIVVTGRAEDAPDANASIAAVEVGDRQLRRAVHELDAARSPARPRASARRSSTARAARGRTTPTRRRSSHPGPTASTCGHATSATSSATTTP